jgi:diguanylate cyclase (GGDEF)-like protein
MMRTKSIQWKSFWLAILIVTVFFLTPSMIYANSNGRMKVKVGYVQSANMMERDDRGMKSGLGYEYLQKISYYTNWEYEYVYGEWNDILQKLIAGEIDVMAGVSKTEEREGQMLFPDYPMGAENYYIYVYDSSPLSTKGIQEIKGRTIGANKDSMMEMLLRKWNKEGGYNVDIRTFSGNEALYENFDLNRVDAVVDTDNAITPEDEMVPLARIGSSDYYLAVSAQRRDLLAQLNVAQSKITSTDPNFVKKLSEKYFSNSVVSAQMQKDERMWIEKHPEITIGYMIDYLPFSDVKRSGEVTGMVADVMNEMMQQLHLTSSVTLKYRGFYKAGDMLKALKADEIDVAFPVNDNVAFADENQIFLSSPVITTAMNLVFKGKYSSKKTNCIAVRKGNEIQTSYTIKHYPNAKIKYYETFEEALDAVRTGDADSIIINDLRKDGYLSHARYKQLKSVRLLDYSSRCLAVNAGNNKLLSILNRGITNLPANYSMLATYPYTGRLGSMSVEDFIVEHWAEVFISIAITVMVLTILGSVIYNIQRKRKMLETMAHKDSLTGLLNRRSFDEQMDRMEESVPDNEMLFVGMDLNGLKKANDTLGHAAGDELIQGAASCMKSVLGQYGQVYRTGGDEFVAILQGKHLNWDKIIGELQKTFHTWKGERNKSLSVAVGYCSNDENPTITPREMMMIADQRLYQDKAEYYRQAGCDRRKR